MKKYQNCDFSFAGLKTSVRLCIEATVKAHEGALTSVWQQRQDEDNVKDVEVVSTTLPSSSSSSEASSTFPLSFSQVNQSGHSTFPEMHLKAEEKLKKVCPVIVSAS
jgi:hypothetical protein